MAASVRGDITLSAGENDSLKSEFQFPAGFTITGTPTSLVQISRGTGTLLITEIATSDNVVSYKCAASSSCTRGSVFLVTITASAANEGGDATVGPLKVTTRITIAGES